MIKLLVTYCLVLNSTQCRVLEMVPSDYRPITSVMDCLMGGAIGSTTFVLDHAEWQVKGWRCVEQSVTADAILDQRLGEK